MKRYDSIDVLRAIAIFLMVSCHFVVYLASPDGAFPGFYFFGDHVIGDPPAAIFLFLVGMSFVISVESSRRGKVQESAILSRGLIRGAVIMVVGLVFEVAVWGYDCLWDWDVLTALGACLVLLALLRNLKPAQLIVLAVVIGLAAPILRDLLGYPAFWEPVDEYAAPWTVKEILGGFLFNAYFPLFPWASYSFFGAAAGKLVFLESDAEKQAHAGRWILISGGVSLLAGFGGLLANALLEPSGIFALYAAPVTFYPLSMSIFLIDLGVTFVLFQGLHVLCDARQSESPVMNFFRRYSRYALTVYVIHHVVLILVPRILGFILQVDDYFYYQALMEAPFGLALSIVFLSAFYPLLVLWDRCGGAFSFEWFLNKCVPKAKKAG